MPIWWAWVFAALAGGGMAGTLYGVLSAPAVPITGWNPRSARLTRDPIPRAWLELTHLPITPNQVLWANRGTALLAAFLVYLPSHNPVLAGAMGWVLYPLPEATLRIVARKQWIALDQQAYLFTQNFAVFLQQGESTIGALQVLVAQTPVPLREMITAALSDESKPDGRFENALKQAASRLQHTELMLLSDIIQAERSAGGAARLLPRLVAFWGRRIESDAQRRGKLKTSMTMGYVLVFGAAAMILYEVFTNVHVQTAASHGIGMVVTAFGGLLVAAASAMQQSNARQAETV